MCQVLLFCLALFIFLPFVVARSECRVRSNVAMVPDVAAAQVQYGAASELEAGLAQPWPEIERNGRKLRVVTYCYSNRAIRDWFDCPRVKEAFDRWRNKLDTPPFKGTTNIAWEELNDGNPDRTQRQPKYCFDANENWDVANIPGDTLWIDIDHASGEGGHFTVGYDPPVADDEVSYRYMKLGPQVTIDAITHEASQRQVLEWTTAIVDVAWTWSVSTTTVRSKLTAVKYLAWFTSISVTIVCSFTLCVTQY